MTESTTQKQIISALKLSGFLIFRMNAGRTTHNVHLSPPGTPDLLTVSPRGETIWIEVKGPKGKLRPAQETMIADLEKRGHRVIVARNVADVATLILDLCK